MGRLVTKHVSYDMIGKDLTCQQQTHRTHYSKQRSWRMSEKEQYRYSAISFSEIRLLNLCPSQQPTDPLRGTIQYQRHESDRESDSAGGAYNALSYTWGDPVFSKPLTIVSDVRNPCVARSEHGWEISITANLGFALRRMRGDSPEIPLWVDAECINQADDMERTSQVQNMGKIFSDAHWVLV
jgi:hypothetical protein